MAINTQDTRITILMTARERHGLTLTALNAVFQYTTLPYRLIYADVQSPAWLRASLETLSAQHGFEWIRFDEHLWPQQVRNALASLIDTEYVVYMDNDIAVQPGWLEHLVACADATQAGIVGPLYLWGDGISTPKVHMAGGQLTRYDTPSGIVLDEQHRYLNADVAQIAPQLSRQPCDFTEFHCMLMRTELVRQHAILDDTIYCVHEHIDAALTATQLGYPVYLEPAARVIYLAFADYHLEDLPLFMRRWSAADAEASIHAFARKWGVANDDRSFGGVRNFVKKHTGALAALRPLTAASADRHAPMPQAALQQTRSGLFDFALAQGYSAEDMNLLAFAYQVAHVLVDGAYRPCGRPFINHLVGSASVLIHYGFTMQIVAAGLLHAVYTHSPAHAAGPQTLIDGLCAMLGGKNSPLEKRVRAYTKRHARWRNLLERPALLHTVNLLDADTLMITAANEIDMHLSGEYRYSGRTDELPSTILPLLDTVCSTLHVSGLALSLRTAAHAHTLATPPELMTGLPGSYRIASDKVNLLPMPVNDIAGML